MFLAATEESKSDFDPHPKGVCKGVCVEVVTKNKQGIPYQSKNDDGGEKKFKMALVFQTEKTFEVEEGELRQCAHWEWFNIPKCILNENGKLHKFLNTWEVEVKGYETPEKFADAVVGRPAHLVFMHNKGNDGKLYSNLTSCTSVDDAEDAYVAKDYKLHNQVPF